jgi:hypothetical protein
MQQAKNQLLYKSAGVFYVIRKTAASISQTTAYAKNIKDSGIDIYFTISIIRTTKAV